MGLARNVAKNTIAMGSVQLASQLSTFILSVFLQLYLGNSYGIYSYAFSLASLIFIISDFGLNFQTVIDVAPNREIAPQYLTNTIFLRIILGTIGMGVTFVVIAVSNLGYETNLAILIIALSTAFNWISQSFTAMLSAFVQMHYIMYTTLVERCFTTSVAIAALFLGYRLEFVIIIVLLGSILNVFLSWAVTSKYIVKANKKPDVKQSMRQLKTALPYAAAGVLNTSMYSLNAVIIWNVVLWTGGGSVYAAHDTALYNLSFNVIVALITIPTVLMTALMPAISRLYRTSSDLTRLTQQKVMKYMFALGIPLSVGGVILAKDIISLIYSPEFIDSYQVFEVLAPVIAISYFGTGLGGVLASAGLVHYNTLSAAIGAGVNAILCCALVPFFGAIGAAAAFTISYVAIVVSGERFMAKKIFSVDVRDILVKPIISAMIMGIVLLILPHMSLIISLLVGVISYFGVFLILGGLNKEDREILKRVMKKGV